MNYFNQNMKDTELNNFITKSKKERKKYIIDLTKTVSVPKNITKKLHQAYKYKEVLNMFIEVYLYNYFRNELHGYLNEATIRLSLQKKNHPRLILKDFLFHDDSEYCISDILQTKYVVSRALLFHFSELQAPAAQFVSV
jgi:hypothetical protein